MAITTHHQAQRARVQPGTHHAGHGGGGAKTMHPERAAVAAHLHRMHSQVTAPGMAESPLQRSEADMLSEGAAQIQRAASTVGT